MAIAESDIKLLASQRLNDDPDGGGFMTGTVVPDGVENNLFPDISDADRVYGRVQLRKVYVAVTSEDADTYMGAHVILDGTPADPAASALMVTKAGYAQERADVIAAVEASNYKVATGASQRILGADVLTAGVSTEFDVDFWSSTTSWWNGFTFVTYFTSELAVGTILGLYQANAADPIPATAGMDVVIVEAVADNLGPVPNGVHANATHVTLAAPVNATHNANVAPGDPSDWAVALTQDVAGGDALLFYGQTLTTAPLALGATVIPIVSSWAGLIPVADGGSYPSDVDPAILGLDPAGFELTGGKVQVFRRNEACVIHDTATTAPATVTNAQDVNLGRTLLSKVRVFGADGNEITAGFTANLATGHVVFTDVTGYSQPVTIQHRIEDMLLVAEAGLTTLVVNRAITHAYPSGAKVSSVMMFGDMQAKAHEGFDQATWTGEWSDALIGSATAAEFNEAASPVVVTNKGAITERWAIIFTNSTSFRVVGEQVGEIMTGTTGTDTAPLNPATLAPYFTLPAAGWGSGWAAGNVYRFNTDGANAPVWLIRSIAPSDPFVGQDSMTVAIRGNVDA